MPIGFRGKSQFRQRKSGSMHTTEEKILEAIENSAQELHTDVHYVANEISFDLRNGLSNVPISDFDVIRSAVEWFADSSESEFWSALFLTLSEVNYTLLPGTLHEMRSYVARRRKEYSYSSSPFDALMDNLLNNEISQRGFVDVEMSRNLKSFEERRIRAAELHVLSVVQERVVQYYKNYHEAFPYISNTMLNWCTDQLSDGARLSRWRNNLVDAFNYCAVFQLNKDIKNTNIRYSFVTNTKAIKRIESSVINGFGDDYMKRNFSDGFTTSPRRAVLYQLFLKAGGNLPGAERVAYEVGSNIADFRFSIVKSRSNSQTSTDGNINTDDDIFKLITNFAQIQSSVDGNKLKNSINIDGVDYNSSDPKAFYDQVDKKTYNLTKKSKIDSIITDFNVKPGVMSLIADNKSPFAESGRAFKITNKFAVAGHCYFDDSDICVYTFNKPPMEEFFNHLNSALSRISRKLSTRTLPEIAGLDEAHICVGAKGSRPCVYSVGDQPYLDLLTIATLADVTPSEVIFIRYDCAYFTLSFEGDMLIFSTGYPLKEEVVSFLRDMCEPKFRGWDFDEAVGELFETCKVGPF